MKHLLTIAISVWSLTGCGLDPNYQSGPDELDKYGVDIKGSVYGVEISEARVVYPPDLQQLLVRANVPTILFGVPEQGVSTFRTFVAASTPQGEQNICATTTELALALWNGPGEFVIEGGRFFVPIAGTEVRFDSTNLDGVITDDGDWDPLSVRARVDTRELTGVFEQDADPCGAAESACVPCEDGLRLCMEVDMDMTAWLLDIDFDPRPDCDTP